MRTFDGQVAVITGAGSGIGRATANYLAAQGWNIGIIDLDDALSTPNATWQRMWDVHVMAHVYASRALLPGMLERGEGYLVNVASAAGLVAVRTRSSAAPRDAPTMMTSADGERR